MANVDGACRAFLRDCSWTSARRNNVRRDSLRRHNSRIIWPFSRCNWPQQRASHIQAPAFWSAIVAWLRTLTAAFQPPPPIFLSGKAALAIGGAATGTLSRGPRPNATHEERIADLEADLSALRSTVTQFSATTRDNFAKVNRHLAEEQDARVTADAESKATVEEFAAGALHLEAVGVAWLLFGILGSNIPEQVARFLQLIL